MEITESVRVFFMDILTPIVEEAVRSAMPEKEQTNERKYLTIGQAREEYQLSTATFYRHFDMGDLNKYKIGGRTMLLKSELEALFKKQSVGGKDMSKYRKRRGL